MVLIFWSVMKGPDLSDGLRSGLLTVNRVKAKHREAAFRFYAPNICNKLEVSHFPISVCHCLFYIYYLFISLHCTVSLYCNLYSTVVSALFNFRLCIISFYSYLSVFLYSLICCLNVCLCFT